MYTVYLLQLYFNMFNHSKRPPLFRPPVDVDAVIGPYHLVLLAGCWCVGDGQLCPAIGLSSEGIMEGHGHPGACAPLEVGTWRKGKKGLTQGKKSRISIICSSSQRLTIPEGEGLPTDRCSHLGLQMRSRLDSRHFF